MFDEIIIFLSIRVKFRLSLVLEEILMVRSEESRVEGSLFFSLSIKA